MHSRVLGRLLQRDLRQLFPKGSITDIEQVYLLWAFKCNKDVQADIISKRVPGQRWYPMLSRNERYLDEKV